MTSVKPARRPRLTARQVGMVAALGGLGFAWRALGLVIPLYPPYVLDIRETLIVIIGFAGGPWVGIASGILMGLPSSVPMCDVFYYPLVAVVVSAVAKTVWRSRGAKGYALLIVTIAIIEAIALIIFNAELAFVLQLVAFWPETVATFAGGTYFVYVAQEVIPLILCIKFFPDFMKPRWLWGGGEEVE